MKKIFTLLFLFFGILESTAGDWTLHVTWATGSNLLAPIPANDTIFISSGDVVRVHLSFTGPGQAPPFSCFHIHESSNVHTSNGSGDFYFTQPGLYEVFFICPTPGLEESFVIAFGTPLGVQEKAAADLRIFPSIIEDQLTVDAGEKEIEVEFRLLNLAGQVVFEKRSAGPGARKYDLGLLPAGLYIAEVRAGERTYVQKLVKK